MQGVVFASASLSVWSVGFLLKLVDGYSTSCQCDIDIMYVPVHVVLLPFVSLPGIYSGRV